MADASSTSDGYVPHAPGYVVNGGPTLLTGRFLFEDSYTLERSMQTGGYAGLRTALSRTPTEVHDEVRQATLLGRGGAGFPAGVKWGFCPNGIWPRYLVANGDESEPGTYKDRLLMERDPHQLIEGCLIACYALGLSQCFLYVRGEMALAQERIAGARRRSEFPIRWRDLGVPNGGPYSTPPPPWGGKWPMLQKGPRGGHSPTRFGG